jgi:hypothetical protein
MPQGDTVAPLGDPGFRNWCSTWFSTSMPSRGDSEGNPSARRARIYAHILRTGGTPDPDLSRSIVAMMKPARSFLRKDLTQTPSQLRDACGPHDGNDHTRRAIALDGVDSTQQCGAAGPSAGSHPTLGDALLPWKVILSSWRGSVLRFNNKNLANSIPKESNNHSGHRPCTHTWTSAR